MTLKLLVCVTQVMDPQASLDIIEDEGAVRQQEPKPVYRLNPADRHALEQAIRIKKKLAAEVTVLTAGPSRARDILTLCLARGADNGIHIPCDEEDRDTWVTAARLATVIKREDWSLVLCGQRTLDRAGGQLGLILAELLGLPALSRVVDVTIDAATRRLIAQRLLERGDREVNECSLPALVSVVMATDEPEYVSVHRHLLSRDGRVTVAHSTMELEVEPLWELVSVSWPRPRPKKIAAPSPEMSAMERIDFIAVGEQAEKEGRLFEGGPEEAADRIVELLQERGYLQLPGTEPR
jgi:electron transfer flavoprotein beta subunit